MAASPVGARAETVLAVDDYSQNWGSPESFQMAKALTLSLIAELMRPTRE